MEHLIELFVLGMLLVVVADAFLKKFSTSKKALYFSKIIREVFGSGFGFILLGIIFIIEQVKPDGSNVVRVLILSSFHFIMAYYFFVKYRKKKNEESSNDNKKQINGK